MSLCGYAGREDDALAKEVFALLDGLAGVILLNLLASLAEFELEMIRERVVAGMERARRQAKKIGRPRVLDRRGLKSRFARICPLFC